MFSVLRSGYGKKSRQTGALYSQLWVERQTISSAGREIEIVILEELDDLKNLNNCTRGESLVESKALWPLEELY